MTDSRLTRRQQEQEEKRNAKFLNDGEIVELLNLDDSRAAWAKRFTHDGIRKYLPYGMWITKDGEHVLFNRSYQPFLRRGADGRVSGVEPDHRVENIRTTYRLFDDGCPPNNLYNAGVGITYEMQQTFLRCCKVLRLFCDNASATDMEQYCLTRVDFDDDGLGTKTKLTPSVMVDTIRVYKQKCLICDQECASGGAMKAHMRFAHGEDQ